MCRFQPLIFKGLWWCFSIFFSLRNRAKRCLRFKGSCAMLYRTPVRTKVSRLGETGKPSRLGLSCPSFISWSPHKKWEKIFGQQISLKNFVELILVGWKAIWKRGKVFWKALGLCGASVIFKKKEISSIPLHFLRHGQRHYVSWDYSSCQWGCEQESTLDGGRQHGIKTDKKNKGQYITNPSKALLRGNPSKLPYISIAWSPQTGTVIQWSLFKHGMFFWRGVDSAAPSAVRWNNCL